MTRLIGNARNTHIELELLSAYLDNQATAAERTRLEAHLRECALCQGELEGLRQTVALVQALPRAPLPRAFTLSEAQVGIKQPAARPAWFGGLLRGLGAVTAVALVALIATTLLRQPATWAPAATMARVTAAPAAAPAAEEAAPAAAPAVVEESVAEAPQAEAFAAEEPAADLAMAAPAEPQADALAAKAAPATEAPIVEAMAAPEAAPALAREVGGPTQGAPAGLGAGGAGDMAAALAAPAAELNAAPAPPSVALAAVLPAQAGLAYTDWQRLVTLDAASDVRELAQAAGAQAPVISDDRAWIAYRAQPDGPTDLRASSWDGATQTVLFTESDLGTEQPGGERRILDVQWIPGRNMLAAALLYYPAGEGAAPVQELWHVGVPGGERRRILEMGPMGRALYAPDGERFAVLEYGTDVDPQGSLTLYNADGGAAQTLLRFPAPPGAAAFDSQLLWLPNGDGLLLAAPETDGVTLHRSDGGVAEQIGKVPAQITYWSPDGSRLAYVQADGSALALAASDGSDPQPYAAVSNGEFLGWSPDGSRFLYADGDNVYAGRPGLAPELLGNRASINSPRWVTSDQIIALLDQGAAQMLVWRDLNTGESASLASLPKDITLDFVSP
jgi:hypothetical protein